MKRALKKALFCAAPLLGVAVVGCGDDTTTGADLMEPGMSSVGFEILQINSPTEIITWLNIDGMTLEEFDALELPWGWAKNQPREGLPSGGSFARSPGATEDGVFTESTLFDRRWRHVATIIETGIPMDDEGLLSGNRIVKHHEVRFDAGTTLHLLMSPENATYVRISRDAGRIQEVPTIPSSWRTVQQVVDADVVIPLPNPTLNIRADNEDSYQGPIPPLSEAP
jgi:hypothetical protein